MVIAAVRAASVFQLLPIEAPPAPPSEGASNTSQPDLHKTGDNGITPRGHDEPLQPHQAFVDAALGMAAAYAHANRMQAPDPNHPAQPVRFVQNPPAGDTALDAARRFVEELRQRGVDTTNFQPSYHQTQYGHEILFGDRFRVVDYPYFQIHDAENPQPIDTYQPPADFLYRAIRTLEENTGSDDDGSGGAAVFHRIIDGLRNYPEREAIWQPDLRQNVGDSLATETATYSDYAGQRTYIFYDLGLHTADDLWDPRADAQHELMHVAQDLELDDVNQPPRYIQIAPGGQPIDEDEAEAAGLGIFRGTRGSENRLRELLNIRLRLFHQSWREDPSRRRPPSSPPPRRDHQARSPNDPGLGPYDNAEAYQQNLTHFTDAYLHRAVSGTQLRLTDDPELSQRWRELAAYRLGHPALLLRDDPALALRLSEQKDPAQFDAAYVEASNERIAQDIGNPAFKDFLRNDGKAQTLALTQSVLDPLIEELFANKTSAMNDPAAPWGPEFQPHNEPPLPDPKPGMEPTLPKSGSEIGSQKPKPITGQKYSDNVKAVARSVQDAMVFGFLSTTFDAKKGFDNETVKQHFLDMAKYRAQSAPTEAINYDDELNATAAALADPVHGIVNKYDGDNEFASTAVKSHFKNLVLQKLIEQQTPAPDLKKAEDAVLQDVRSRLMNALNGRSDKNLRLQIYDAYVSDPDAGKNLADFVANEANLVFTNDPYLYLRPNVRGQDGFPWQLVLDDIDNEVKLQSYKYGKRDLYRPFEDYMNREGRALVQQWWQTSATP